MNAGRYLTEKGLFSRPNQITFSNIAVLHAKYLQVFFYSYFATRRKHSGLQAWAQDQIIQRLTTEINVLHRQLRGSDNPTSLAEFVAKKNTFFRFVETTIYSFAGIGAMLASVFVETSSIACNSIIVGALSYLGIGLLLLGVLALTDGALISTRLSRNFYGRNGLEVKEIGKAISAMASHDDGGTSFTSIYGDESGAAFASEDDKPVAVPGSVIA